MFYAVTTTVAAGIFGTSLLDTLNIWNNPPDWGAVHPRGRLPRARSACLASSPVRKGDRALLAFEGGTVALPRSSS